MNKGGITADPAGNLSAGLKYHRCGDFAAATRCYLDIPADHAAYPDALHLMGLLAFQRGDLGQAEASIVAAIGLRANVADFHYNHGSVLAAMGRQAEAIGAYRRSLKLKPQDAAALNNLGNALLATEAADEAEAAFRQALKYDRDNAVVICNLGNALKTLGRGAQAGEAYRKSLQLSPGYAEAAVNLAALCIDGDSAAQDLPTLAALLEEVLNANPDSVDVMNSLAVVWRELGKEAAAEPLLRRALALEPQSAAAWNNLGTVLKDLGRHAEAEACVVRAIALQPGYGLAYTSLGTILLESRRAGEAEAAYRRAVELLPERAEAHCNLGLARLLLGDLAQGFELFEWRMRLPRVRHLYPDLGAPLWLGEPLAGRRLLLHAEQGLGDTLQFIRYAPLLAERGAEVIVRCPAPLRRLLMTVPGVSRVLAEGESAEEVAFVCPIVSLPQRFATTLATVPAEVPYLSIPEASREVWRTRLAKAPSKPRVGLVWAGDPRPGDKEAQRIDRRRSLPLQALSPILQLEGVEFHSLQLGLAKTQLADSACRDRLLDWSEALTDLAETGALIEQLDLVISVDTAVVHLAGALARPVWVLSRFDACWRWLLGRSDSPWYPTLRLFRCESPQSWPAVVMEVREALAAWLVAKASAPGQ